MTNLQRRVPALRFATFGAAILFVTLLAAAVRPAAASGTLTVTPTGVSFGNVAVGTTNSQAVQLKNTGSTSLTISSATMNGAGFSMSGFSTGTIAAGASINATVKFAPVAAVGYLGIITVASNASNPSVSFTMTGYGVGSTRTLSLSSTALSFGNEGVGRTSALDVTVKNTGNSSVLISQLSVTGTGFSIVSNLTGITLAAGQSTNLQLEFAPKEISSVTGKVVLTSNASNSPGSIALSGTGVSSTGHSVALSWTASTSSGITGYNVYRSATSGGAYTKLNSSPTASAKYTDGSVSAGATYYYVVTAVSSSGGESTHSNQISTVIP